ncbi:hypothetical protein SAMN04488063_0334 [Halopelagius inordinatus]|uniref:Uncharacterized protein n=1 Tax=Halopelagius inordinatus TaxID=553467 RepID=A0A1I2LNJ0_9EURY|nr:hypothetical protein [Halopelagius inordinatus]SFF80030.1 hypothetical protein SAMN04488063_0334 [Halopelagius inordinatus]
MTAPAHDCPTTLDLSRQEAWVLHTALLDTVERELDEGNDAERALTLLVRLEEGKRFDREQLKYLTSVLRSYIDGGVPPRDRSPARDILQNVQTALA